MTNQKIGLCEALLKIGAWSNTKEILDRLPEFFAMVHKPIAAAMCSLVHYLIDPLYREWVFPYNIIITHINAVEMKGHNWILQYFQYEEKTISQHYTQIRNIEKGGE